MYRDHSFVSNSELKELFYKDQGRIEPPNLAQIFDFGSRLDKYILEPNAYKPNGEPDADLIRAMAATFFNDSICQQMIMISDFRRKHRWFRIKNALGLEGVKMEADGDSKRLSTILELKGLSVRTEKAFKDSIYQFDYDQGAAWYLDVSGYKQCLIVGLSKKDPSKLFKMLIDRNHEFYRSGVAKIHRCVRLWKSYGLQ